MRDFFLIKNYDIEYDEINAQAIEFVVTREKEREGQRERYVYNSIRFISNEIRMTSTYVLSGQLDNFCL